MNVRVFDLFFISLLLVCLVLLALLHKLPEQAGVPGPPLQGGWMLRPFRAVANLINLVEPTPEKKPDDFRPPPTA